MPPLHWRCAMCALLVLCAKLCNACVVRDACIALAENYTLNNKPKQHRAKNNCQCHCIHLVHFFLVRHQHKKCNNKLQCCIVWFRQLAKQLLHDTQALLWVLATNYKHKKTHKHSYTYTHILAEQSLTKYLFLNNSWVTVFTKQPDCTSKLAKFPNKTALNYAN